MLRIDVWLAWHRGAHGSEDKVHLNTTGPHCDSNDVKCRTQVGAQRDKELPQRDLNKEVVSPRHHATHAAASCCLMLLLLAFAAASSCCCSWLSLLQLAFVAVAALASPAGYCCSCLRLLQAFSTAAAGFRCCWILLLLLLAFAAAGFRAPRKDAQGTVTNSCHYAKS